MKMTIKQASRTGITQHSKTHTQLWTVQLNISHDRLSLSMFSPLIKGKNQLHIKQNKKYAISRYNFNTEAWTKVKMYKTGTHVKSC